MWQICVLGYQVNTLNNYEYPEPPQVEVKPKTTEQKIIYEAERAGVDKDLALSIAWCESNFVEDAKNPTSSATGIYQFINSTWNSYCEGDRLNEDDNIKCAVQLLSEGGEGHWKASQHCWDSEVALYTE